MRRDEAKCVRNARDRAAAFMSGPALWILLEIDCVGADRLWRRRTQHSKSAQRMCSWPRANQTVTCDTNPRRAAIWALVCSFAIYFIPIIGPHAAFFVYETILQQFRGPQKNAVWLAVDLGAAFAFQVVAFSLFYVLWRRRGVLAV